MMHEIKVDEPQEEKKQRVVEILIRSPFDAARKYKANEKDIISMTNVLRFIDDKGVEHVYGNTPYSIEFYE